MGLSTHDARAATREAGGAAPEPAGRGAALAWRYLAALVVLGVVYALLSPSLAADVVYVIARLTTVAAIVVGVRRHRPRERAGWWLLLGGVVAFLAGTVTFGLTGMIGGGAPPFPSVADVCYLAAYPLWAAGLGRFARVRRPGDVRGLLDAAIIAVAAAVLAWEFLMQPFAADGSLSLAARLVAVAYPAVDVVLLGVAARLALGGGRRSVALRLLVVGLAVLLVADLGYAVQRTTGDFTTGNVLSLGWFAFFALWGTAALHPSMTALTEPDGDGPSVLTIRRLVTVATPVLVIPAVTAVQAALGARPDLVVLTVGWLVALLLGIVRVAGLVADIQRFLVQLRAAERRERVLREAGTRLVAAATRDERHDAALDAALRLADGAAVAVAVSGRPVGAADAPGDPVVLAWRGDLSAEGRNVVLPLRTGAGAGSGGAAAGPGAAEALVVRVDEELSADAVEGLAALATQVALALESAALVEEAHRRAGEARFRSLVQKASDVITIVDRDGTVRYVSPSVEAIFGYRPAQLVGVALRGLVHPDDVADVDAALGDVTRAPQQNAVVQGRIRAADGAWRWFESSVVNLIDDPNVAGVVLTTRDVSDRRALEEQLRHQAFHDPLTGLANRALFSDRVEHALARRSAGGHGVAVVFVDLDDFKTVNDSLGHEAGDSLLVTVARRIGESVRAADTAARLGGDEFAILVEDAVPGTVDAVVTRVLDGLAEPVEVEGEEIVCSASVGIAVGDGDETATVLLRNADVAMYAAKGAGKARAETFSPAMHASAVARLQVKADLQRALDRGELRLRYQPIVALDGRDGAPLEVVGFEALVRWQHPNRGLVGPAEFVPVAEETGLVVPLGAWVLAEACAEARRWQLAHPRAQPLRVSVNLSARQFTDRGLAGVVAAALETSGLSPGSLVVELTESVLVADLDATAARLAELRDLGVAVALDDFGTGYSSLSYLHRFPVDYLKIDRSFVAGIVPDAAHGGVRDGGQDEALARGIVRLAATLGVTAVAEGVETPAQLAALRALGCPLGQGHLFSRPVDPVAVDLVLAQGLTRG